MRPRMTPLEVQKREFSRRWKGLDPVEVQQFLTDVAEDMEALARENADLDVRLRTLEQENEEHRERERILKQTLLSAQQASEDIRNAGAQGGRAHRPRGAGLLRAADAQRPAALGRDREGHPGPEDPARQLPAPAPEDGRALRPGPRVRQGRGRQGSAGRVHDAQGRRDSRVVGARCRRLPSRLSKSATSPPSRPRSGPRPGGESSRGRSAASRTPRSARRTAGSSLPAARRTTRASTAAGRRKSGSTPRGRAVVPGLVDAHTHPVWLGDRGPEIGRRLAGESYAAIAAEGGGIHATVRATRAGTDARAARGGRAAALGDARARNDDGRGQVRLRADGGARDPRPADPRLARRGPGAAASGADAPRRARDPARVPGRPRRVGPDRGRGDRSARGAGRPRAVLRRLLRGGRLHGAGVAADPGGRPARGARAARPRRRARALGRGDARGRASAPTPRTTCSSSAKRRSPPWPPPARSPSSCPGRPGGCARAARRRGP